MSDTENQAYDELTTLKARADLMGISYHPSIGVDKLREKVRAALTADTEEAKPAASVPSETEGQIRQRKIEEATRLVRIRLTCMNPLKKEWDGEIITVGNSLVGTLKKFIPFNAEDGWHVPHMMYEELRDRQFQTFFTRTNDRGNKVRDGKLVKEFAIELLPPLTAEELEELAREQAVGNRVG